MKRILEQTSSYIIWFNELTSEEQTKICYIQDIAKLHKLYKKHQLTMNEFDILYDCSVPQLERVWENTRDSLEREKAIEEIWR